MITEIKILENMSGWYYFNTLTPYEKFLFLENYKDHRIISEGERLDAIHYSIDFFMNQVFINRFSFMSHAFVWSKARYPWLLNNKHDFWRKIAAQQKFIVFSQDEPLEITI